MKQKPLKDKTQSHCHRKDLTDRHDIHDDIDIKSAVEWLLNKKLGDKLKPFDFEGNEMIVFYKEDFDKAFEDVTLESNPPNKQSQSEPNNPPT